MWKRLYRLQRRPLQPSERSRIVQGGSDINPLLLSGLSEIRFFSEPWLLMVASELKNATCKYFFDVLQVYHHNILPYSFRKVLYSIIVANVALGFFLEWFFIVGPARKNLRNRKWKRRMLLESPPRATDAAAVGSAPFGATWTDGPLRNRLRAPSVIVGSVEPAIPAAHNTAVFSTQKKWGSMLLIFECQEGWLGKWILSIKKKTPYHEMLLCIRSSFLGTQKSRWTLWNRANRCSYYHFEGLGATWGEYQSSKFANSKFQTHWRFINVTVLLASRPLERPFFQTK